MELYCVYMHIKKVTGGPFYVGKGKAERAMRFGKRSELWKNYANKYGYDVIFLEENLDEKTALEREVYWIKRIGRLKLGTGPLINFTDGGEGISGFKHSEQSKLKMRNSTLGTKQSKETIEKKRLALIGSKRSKETKNILSKQKLADKNPMSKKVIDTSTGIIYPTLKNACEVLGYKYICAKDWLNPNRNVKNKTTLKYI